jgi:cytochrome c
MRNLVSLTIAATVLMVTFSARADVPNGDAKRGAQLYRTCAACHSLVPDRNMTGPSLAGIWGRKAASLESFERYSPALKASTVVWEAETIDQWIEAPARMIPHNRMTFAGIPDAQARADLIAFLRSATAQEAQPGPRAPSGGMGGGTAPQFEDLKKLGADHQVQAIRYCRDTYHVTTEDGETADFWEVNLRFKTDSSDTGPLSGKPVILGAGMTGDRASVFFASPEEIGAFIKPQC